MQKMSNCFVLLNKDFKNGDIKVHDFKDMIEYWVFRPKKSSIVGVIGQPIELDEKTLYAVIVCLRDRHIVDKTEDKMYIRGVRFTNDVEGNDLDEYIKKTGRRA